MRFTVGEDVYQREWCKACADWTDHVRTFLGVFEGARGWTWDRCCRCGGRRG